MSATKSAEITQIYERNQEATLYVGNLDYQIDESLLWEVFVQCGPMRNVHIPRDKITGAHSNYGFVEFENEVDAEYAIKIMNMIKLYGKPIRCNKASQDRRTQEIGANLFVGNLDSEVDDKLLFDTFSAFGTVISTKVMRDPEVGGSKGYGFVSFDSFEASDACLAAMNGQFLCNRPIHVSYAYKKDTKGERHGSAAERLIAANRPLSKTKSQTNLPASFPAPSFAPGMAGMLPPFSSSASINGFSDSSGVMGSTPLAPQLSNPQPPLYYMPPTSPETGTTNSDSAASYLPPPPGSSSQRNAPPMSMQASSVPPLPGTMNANMRDMPRFPPLPNAFPGLPAGLPPPPMLFPSRPGFGIPAGMPPLPNGIPAGMPLPPGLSAARRPQ